MADPREIELVLHTGDEHIVNAAESALPDTVTKTRVPTTRVLDIVTILLTATAAIKLI
jgi:ribose 1,5-bisphosphokinase PhnN